MVHKNLHYPINTNSNSFFYLTIEICFLIYNKIKVLDKYYLYIFSS